MTITITFSERPTLADHPIDGPYVRDVWAAIIGPGATLLLERSRQLRLVHGDPATVPIGDVADWLGVMPAKVRLMCGRLETFRLATWDGSTLTTVSHVRGLSPEQVRRAGAIPRRIHAALSAVGVA